MNKNVEHDLKVGHQVKCQICGCTDLIPIVDLGFIAPCDSLLWPEQLKKAETLYPLNLVRCPECTLVQIDYVVDHEELFFPEYPYRSGITPTLVDNLRSTGSTIVNRYNIAKGKLAIDIGSNDGTLLTGFKDIGLRVLGVEPTNIAEIANGNGIETIKEFFTEDVARGIVEKYGSASVVTAANMFAHVAQLGSLIRGAEHLLVDDGLFVTESHYLLDLLDTVQYDTIYHEHLKYYSMHSIIRLFDDYSFTVVDVDRIPNYGGSIRVYAMKGKGRNVSSSVNQLLTEEMNRGIGEAKIFNDFVKRVRQSKLDLQKLIVEAQENGEEVVGVGSPGRAATLLGYCNIDVDQMTYIAEQSTSLKLGLFMPGVHIPIVDEERLLREQPTYAVMLSWHYWQPIVKKLREKGLKSKIVLPLPELVILED
tara:strand:+ start:14364 stop:15629 length:1266 start_codon:yes stop_codon:yes gene_type:complete